MTARQFFSGNRWRPVQPAVVLMLLLVAALLVAGCDYVPHPYDLVIVKLNHDGSTAWIQKMESGKNYQMNDAFQTSDGGYAIGGREDRIFTIIRLAGNGEIVSELGFPSEVNNQSDQIVGLVQTPDGGFYTVSNTGMVSLISPSGIFKENRFLDTLNKTSISSFIRTHDGGSIVSGQIKPCEFDHKGVKHCEGTIRKFKVFVEKIDQNGNTSWSRSYIENGFYKVDQISEIGYDKGYASVMGNKSNEYLVFLDKNGRIINTSQIESDLIYYQLNPVNDGVIAFCENDSSEFASYEIHYFSDKGIRVDTKYLGGDGYGYVFQERNTSSGKNDLNFVSVDFGTKGIHVRKSNGDGEVIGDYRVTTVTSGRYYPRIWDFIETSDGGYLVVLGIERG